MNMWSKPRPRRPHRPGLPDAMPDAQNFISPTDRVVERYLDDMGRERIVIDNSEDVFEPAAPVVDPKGETIIVDLEKRPAQRVCAPGEHDIVEDDTEPDFVAEKCRRCPYGCLVRPKRKSQA